MTRRGRFAALVPAMPIAALLFPAVMQMGAPQGSSPFGRAWIAFSPLAALTGPALGIGANPTVAAGLAKGLLFWPVAVFGVLAAWLVRLRHARWSRIAVDHGAAVITSESWPEVAPEPMPPRPPEIVPRIADRTRVEGADLAARARFVAMSFAFPEAGLVRANSARDGLGSWPLHMDCRPTRFTLTLQHAALGYRLEFCNRGAEPLGPLMIRADLVPAESRTAPGPTDALPLCHYLDGLPIGDSIELTGELRLPLAGIAAMRLGSAELLVPLMRICAESAGNALDPLNASACFAVGLPPLVAGGGIQPFRLDSGPRIWRKLTARRVNRAGLS